MLICNLYIVVFFIEFYDKNNKAQIQDPPHPVGRHHKSEGGNEIRMEILVLRLLFLKCAEMRWCWAILFKFKALPLV